MFLYFIIILQWADVSYLDFILCSFRGRTGFFFKTIFQLIKFSTRLCYFQHNLVKKFQSDFKLHLWFGLKLVMVIIIFTVFF